MATIILDYQFTKPTGTSADGAYAYSFAGVTPTAGPGASALGNLQSALDFASTSSGSATIAGLKPDLRQFCVQVVFRVDAAVIGRQYLVESSLLPIALALDHADAEGEFVLSASINAATHGGNGPTTRYAIPLVAGRWYTATLAYDFDTAALFVDDKMTGVYAFPIGRIAPGTGTTLQFGNRANPAPETQFTGALAAFRWFAGIPADFEAQLDEGRSSPQWFTTYKYEQIRTRIALGTVSGALSFDAASGMFIQHYEKGAITFHDGLSSAYEMHGAIYSAYMSLPNAAELGFLVSDESPARRAGGRKNVFSKGALYWSSAHGAVPVYDKIYLEYENLGESSFLGFPVRAAAPVLGGLEQEFEQGRMYSKKNDAKAHEVHGKILAKFLQTGGLAQWGFPISNESDLIQEQSVVGKFSDFPSGTIYWSAKTGAYGVRGVLRTKYRDLNGPLGALGFPTSDQIPIPGVAGTSAMNTFENGSLLRYPGSASVVAALPFKVFVGRISTKKSEGMFMGQNDLYCYISAKEGNTVLLDKRYPEDGDWSGNVHELNVRLPFTFVPNRASKVLTYSVDVREADPGSDDKIGKWTKTLNAANAWGLKDTDGVFNSGAFDKIRSITSAVQPQLSARSLSETQKFWGVRNQGTPTISWQQYASAFKDVDSDTEWWDATDWLDKAFYELVVDSLASKGNCFGMSLEAIRARKGSSLFALPIDRFQAWDTVRNEFNIKHCYQVGAEPIWWFLSQFASGNTHDPKDVFSATRAAFESGDPPVLCISQEYDFGGKPHCVLPVAWDGTQKPWRITICDPNAPGVLRYLTVDPDKNTFHYEGSDAVYDGGAWSGGRMHYMPYSVLSGRQRTPVWDAILLLLAGTIIVVGEDGETSQISDLNGQTLDAFSSRATEMLKSGRDLEDFFVSFKGSSQRPPSLTDAASPLGGGDVLQPVRPSSGGQNPIAGELWLRKRTLSQPGLGDLAHLPLGALLADRRLQTLSAALGARPDLRRALEGRTVAHILADAKMSAALQPEVMNQLRGLMSANAQSNFVHEIKGKRAGEFRYVVKHGLTEVVVKSSLAAAEANKIKVSDLGSSRNAFEIQGGSNKPFSLEITHKLTIKRDWIRLKIDNVVAASGQPIKLNVKSGLGGVDLVTGAKAAAVSISVEGRLDGKVSSSQFDLPLEGGARIRPASALTENAMSFSRIDRLFGPSRGSVRLQAK